MSYLSKELTDEIDQVLIAGLPDGLKQSIDRLLAAGVKKKEIVRKASAHIALTCTGQAGQLTLCAIRAYLESKETVSDRVQRRLEELFQ